MNQVKLPALVGESPLAILAAIGTLRLIHDFVDEGARLSWDPADRAPVLHSKLPSVDAVAEELAEIVAEMPDDVVVPGGPAGFPLERIGTKGSDPMRPLPGGMADLFATLTAGSCESEVDTVAIWMGSLVTDLVFRKPAKKGESPVGMVSQFIAGAGQQTIATMLEKSHESVRSHPEYLYQALAGWRRVEGVTGEYLDHRAIWSATDDPRGQNGKMRGVPGATWLALMSYPLWTTTAAGKQPRTSGWHTADRRRQELRLPLWQEPLGPAAIKALVEHPVLEGKGETKTLDAAALRLLGIFHVCNAHRRQTDGGKSAGVLVPVS
ncbi:MULTISPECIES: hypothetical protein [Actinomyces]|uniref:Uncharacterized protein n=1 Tax=Actinomyces glycerinitolerans TaxID=1892869 RepID=A0A1M4S097_9ACTO|nr:MULTISPECIES: hypothetical protein [Actinomyces]SHE25632.1 Hypothetical protein ACGLYG10_1857 [Actinomyces glycerinitolerans]